MMMRKEDARLMITEGIRRSEQVSSSMTLTEVKISITEVIWVYTGESTPNLMLNSQQVTNSERGLLEESEDVLTLLLVAVVDLQQP
jgi:hypothetical protein